MPTDGATYMVLTSDGVVHETDSAEQFVSWIGEYGFKVIDHGAPAEQWTELARALAEKLIPEPLDEDTRNALFMA